MGETDADFSRALIALMKGVLYKDRQPELWQTALAQRNRLEDYVAALGLRLLIDEVDEYAYLRQQDTDELPRLVPRHPLSYPVSLLLVLLRKSLGEYEAVNGDSRLVLTRDAIADKMRVFFQTTTNEIKWLQEIDRYIARVEALGFLRRLKDRPDAYEIERVLRGFVNAEWLRQFDERLEEYRRFGLESGETPEEGGGMDGIV